MLLLALLIPIASSTPWQGYNMGYQMQAMNPYGPPAGYAFGNKFNVNPYGYGMQNTMQQQQQMPSGPLSGYQSITHNGFKACLEKLCDELKAILMETGTKEAPKRDLDCGPSCIQELKLALEIIRDLKGELAAQIEGEVNQTEDPDNPSNAITIDGTSNTCMIEIYDKLLLDNHQIRNPEVYQACSPCYKRCLSRVTDLSMITSYESFKKWLYLGEEASCNVEQCGLYCNKLHTAVSELYYSPGYDIHGNVKFWPNNGFRSCLKFASREFKLDVFRNQGGRNMYYAFFGGAKK